MKDQPTSRKSARASLASLMLIASLIISGCSADLSSDELVARAGQSYAAGDYNSSIIDLKNALQENPQSSAARLLLGQIYVATGDGASAEKELRQAIELGVPEATVLTSLATALLQQGKFSDVMEEITVPSALPPRQQTELHLARGKAFLAQGEQFEAGFEFDAALETDAESPASWEGQALQAFIQRQWDVAQGWLDKLLSDDPESAQYWGLKADMERAQGNDELAKEDYGEAIKYAAIDSQYRLKRALVSIALEEYTSANDDIKALQAVAPNAPQVNYVLGLWHFRQQQYPEAQGAFEQTLAVFPKHELAMFYLGAAHFAQNHLSQAENYLSRFLSLHPESEEAAKLVAAVRLSSSDPQGAEEVLKPVLENSPDDPTLNRLLGNAYLDQGKMQQGISQLKKALSMEPDPFIQTQIGLTLLASGKQDEGVEELETALSMDSQSARLETTSIIGLMYAGKYDKALAAIDKLEAEQPDSPAPLGLLGAVYMEQNDNAEARTALQSALEMSPGYPLAGLLLARLNLLEGKPELARALYEQVLDANPGHLITLMQFAALEGKQGKPEKARNLLKRAIEDNPRALEPRLWMANYYLYINKPAEALGVIQPIIEAYPKQPVLLAVLGQAQLAINSPENALNSYRSLSQILPESAQVHYLLAQAYVATNNAGSAEKELNMALEANPGHGLAKIALARLSVLRGKPEEANNLLTELQQSFPDHPEIFNLQGWMAMQAGKPDVAAAAYKESLNRSSNNLAVINLANAQWQARDTYGSLATLETWLEKHPTDLLALYSAGSKYVPLGKSDKAVRIYSQIIEIDPTSALAHNNLAWLYRKTDPDKAWQNAKRSLELAPSNPAVMDTVGMLLLDQEKNSDALELLSAAARKAPKNWEIQYHLALALARTGQILEAQRTLESIPVNDATTSLQGKIADLIQEMGG